jgi:hypothetical protein
MRFAVAMASFLMKWPGSNLAAKIFNNALERPYAFW